MTQVVSLLKQRQDIPTRRWSVSLLGLTVFTHRYLHTNIIHSRITWQSMTHARTSHHLCTVVNSAIPLSAFPSGTHGPFANVQLHQVSFLFQKDTKINKQAPRIFQISLAQLLV